MEKNIKELLDEVRVYASTELKSQAKQFDQDEHYPKEIMDYLFQQELLHLLIDFNGFKGTFGDFLRVIRIISKHFAAVGSILLTQAACGVFPMYHFGTMNQKVQYLERILSGECIASFAVNEPESGSYLENIRTTAVKKSDGWVLNGEKVSISNAPIANLFYIAARIENEFEDDQFGLFLVERDTPGFEVGESDLKMGIKALPVGSIHLDNVKIPLDSILGNDLNGAYQVEMITNRLRLAIAAQSLGIAQGAMERGLKYVTFDRRFGQRLIDLQNTQLRLAEAQTRIESARAYTARVYEESCDDTIKVSMAKLLASDVAIEITETIMQVTGGYAYMRNNEIERFVRDAKLTAIYGGSSTTQKRIISQPWLKKNKEE